MKYGDKDGKGNVGREGEREGDAIVHPVLVILSIWPSPALWRGVKDKSRTD